MKIIGIAGAVSITALVAALALAAPAGADEPDWLPEIADSAAVDSAPVATGVILHEDGTPFAAGSKVVLSALPSASVISALAVGESFVTTPVAKGEVAADGKFALRIEDVDVLQRFADPDTRVVDLQVEAVDDLGYGLYAFSRRLVVDSGERYLIPTATLPTADAEAAAQKPQIAEIDALEDVDALATLADAGGIVDKTTICRTVLVASYPGIDVRVGATFGLSATSKAKFTYTSTAESTLGVGTSVTGSSGSWSASGTLSKSSASTTTFAQTVGRKFTGYTTNFTYGKYDQLCHDLSGGAEYHVNYFFQPIKHDGGGSPVTLATVPTATHCVDLGAGAAWSTTTATATTFSTGAAVSSVIGINLSSRTGYTTKAKITYTNSATTAKGLCGSNTTPNGAAAVILG